MAAFASEDEIVLAESMEHSGPDPLLLKILSKAVEGGASDIILRAGSKAQVRQAGVLHAFGDRPLTAEDTSRMLTSVLDSRQREEFETTWEIDLAVHIASLGRFRVNGYRQQQQIAVVLRTISSQIPTVDTLQLPQVIREMATYPRGLVLVTGPTGSGKSTLLAAIVDKINSDRACHIVTIEDPIEFVHPCKKSTVSQREVGRDTQSFAKALKGILRQSPDVILVGEMRDPETMAAGLTLAETGHLVFSTLHTQTCGQTINRILDAFPPESQGQIRSQLALTLRAVVCQVLLPTPDGKKRMPAREIMVVNRAISAVIREQRVHEIVSYIQTGAQVGMTTMKASIEKLIAAGQVNREEAMAKLTSVEQSTAASAPVVGGAAASSRQLVGDASHAAAAEQPASGQPFLLLSIVACALAGAYGYARGPQTFLPLKLDHVFALTAMLLVLYVVRGLLAMRLRVSR